jgi:transcriptional regulator with XRE-family HTH domain
MNAQPTEPSGIGEILRAARVAKGLNQQALARELRMPLHLLAAIETEDWKRIPPGRERPLTRRVAAHLGIDLSLHQEAWELLPGGVAQEAPDPAKERLERALMGGLTLGSVALFLWLVIPGRDIKGQAKPREPRSGYAPMAVWVPRTPPTAYPVLGEVLPEAPITSEGTLVSLRAMDACLGQIVGEGIHQSMPLRVSEPWTLRVKGGFTLSLDNAGVVTVEVAGRRINHGRAVGEAWSAVFDAEGRLVPPVEEAPKLPLHVPQTDPETPTEE